ncbi:putative bifunctional diguanylate cyclase/phosphodiesterase [Parasphingorhabdus sp.]|uniref:putative bifunctional diguanylate cyclase/phosphodiesterase n=1 Tax=Parasphingorhabdus sp. TaxID=2709688 RepID=UPI003A95735D
MVKSMFPLSNFRSFKVHEISISTEHRAEFRNLFLLSFHERDPLAAEIASFGWRVHSARRLDNLSARFYSAGAMIAVIDTRKADKDGLTAIAELSKTTIDAGVAIFALVDSMASPQIVERCYDSGATHYLDTANAEADLAQSIKYAYRYVENFRGGAERTSHEQLLLTVADLQWSMQLASMNEYWISESLLASAGEIDFQQYPVTGIYRGLSFEERKRVRGAMGRLRDGARQAAVPHHLNGRPVIHHLHEAEGRIFGRIEYLANNDEVDNWSDRDLLSGLSNTAAVRSWIRQKLDAGRPLTLIAIGIKNFRMINAAFGRKAGDQFLRIVGHRLMDQTHRQYAGSQIVARLDGQNFLIALADIRSDEISVFANELLITVFREMQLEGRSINPVARAGVAIGNANSKEKTLIRKAVLALAEATAADALPIHFSAVSEADVHLEEVLEDQLAGAMGRGEIVIAFQPQIKIDTGQLVGAEALARWEHPEYGLLGASTLFAVAERAGVKESLSAQIHKQALILAARWPGSLAFLRLSLNVTASDLATITFDSDILKQVENAGFKPHQLTLEITESELISNMAASVDKLQRLQAVGVRIAIDDFGTGYSSLAYLKELPIDYLKIDSGLTGDISGSPKEQVVVRSIIDMAHSLHLSVIAEGVETEAQLETLAELGCEYFQGFLRSGPLSPDEFETFALLNS